MSSTVGGPLAGRRVVVTGAARGLGASAALALSRAGAHCLLVDRSAVELAKTAGAMSGGAQVLVSDLADRGGQADAAAHAATFARGDLGALVHCAGVLSRRSLGLTDDQAWDETLAVNLTSAFVFLRELLPALEAGGGGSVVLTSSRAGVSGFADEAAYCASKFGVEGLARAAAAERRGSGVVVNTVTPGARIKPTGMTVAEERELTANRRAWGSSEPLGAAFVALALLGGEDGAPTGQRFRCDRVAERARASGARLPLQAWKELAE